MKEFVDVLDEAVAQLRDGDEVDSVLVAFPTDAPALAPLLESAAALAQLHEVEMPARADLAADRYHFLEQAAQLRERTTSPSFTHLSPWAVSPGLLARLKTWTQKTLRWPFPPRTEERQPMFALLAKIIVIAALGLGAAGGTVAAAAGSLPDTALYPVKLGVEELRMALTGDPVEQAELAMEQVQARLGELQKLMVRGVEPTEETMNRFHVQLQNALQKMAQLEDDEELKGLLQQTREQIRVQENELEEVKLQLHVRAQAQAKLGIIEETLALTAGDLEAGLVDPALYRHRYAEGRPEDAPEQPDVEPPAALQQKGPAGDATGPQEPVRQQQDNGPSDARPEDLEEPVRNREEVGPQPEEPGVPVQNQEGEGNGPAEEAPGSGEPIQNENQNEYKNQNENSQDIQSQEQEQQQNQGPTSETAGGKGG